MYKRTQKDIDAIWSVIGPVLDAGGGLNGCAEALNNVGLPMLNGKSWNYTSVYTFVQRHPKTKAKTLTEATSFPRLVLTSKQLTDSQKVKVLSAYLE